MSGRPAILPCCVRCCEGIRNTRFGAIQYPCNHWIHEACIPAEESFLFRCCMICTEDECDKVFAKHLHALWLHQLDVRRQSLEDKLNSTEGLTWISEATFVQDLDNTYQWYIYLSECDLNTFMEDVKHGRVPFLWASNLLSLTTSSQYQLFNTLFA